MIKQPSLELLESGKRSVETLSAESVAKLLKEYEEKLAKAAEKIRVLPVGLIDTEILGQTLSEAVQGYVQIVKQLSANIDAEKHWKITEIIKVTEQTGEELEILLRQVLELLGKLGQNADLEREVLGKLNARLSK